jgi:hypothetical protein
MGNIKRRRFKSDASDYAIGFCKPPRHSQYKPGQSGYLKGRPKGARNFKTIVKATLKAPVRVTRDGKSRKISTLEALLLRLREKGLSGDHRAVKVLIELAQAYCEEEITASGVLSAEDTKVLQIYKRRVLSGVAANSELIPDYDDSKRTTELGELEKISVKRGLKPAGHTPTTNNSDWDK